MAAACKLTFSKWQVLSETFRKWSIQDGRHSTLLFRAQKCFKLSQRHYRPPFTARHAFRPRRSPLIAVAVVTDGVFFFFSAAREQVGRHGYSRLSVTERKQMKVSDVILSSEADPKGAGLQSPSPAAEHAGSSPDLRAWLPNSLSLSHPTIPPDLSSFFSFLLISLHLSHRAGYELWVIKAALWRFW